MAPAAQPRGNIPIAGEIRAAKGVLIGAIISLPLWAIAAAVLL